MPTGTAAPGSGQGLAIEDPRSSFNPTSADFENQGHTLITNDLVESKEDLPSTLRTLLVDLLPCVSGQLSALKSKPVCQ